MIKKTPLQRRKYYVLVWVVILGLVAFFAYQDTVGASMWKSVGGWDGEVYTKAEPLYMRQFWTFAYVTVFVVAGMFYYFRRDLSEALGILLGAVLMLWAGLEDLLFYFFKGLPLDASMPWLWNNPISIGSRILGESTVTPAGLWLNLIIFTIIAIFVVRYLRGLNLSVSGIKV